MASELYLPLETTRSIRLLRLLPGPSVSDLRAELFETSLDAPPVYEAISYTWGEETCEKPLWITGQAIYIMQNLYDLILRLRSRTTSRTLWVDAISISQSCPIEKGQQVALIGDIFGSAERVLVWVGEHADGSEALFRPSSERSVRDTDTRYQQTRSVGLLSNLEDEVRLTQRHLPLIEAQRRVWIWNPFLARPHWRRLWIVQEVVLASFVIIHCGDSSASWQGLIQSRVRIDCPIDQWCTNFDLPWSWDDIPLEDGFLNSLAAMDLKTHSFEIRDLIILRHIHHAGKATYKVDQASVPAEKWFSGDDIGSLSEICSRKKCSDRRDFVYALLSLESRAGLLNSVPPDYTIDAAQLFVRACFQSLVLWSQQKDRSAGSPSDQITRDAHAKFVRTLMFQLLGGANNHPRNFRKVADMIIDMCDEPQSTLSQREHGAFVFKIAQFCQGSRGKRKPEQLYSAEGRRELRHWVRLESKWLSDDSITEADREFHAMEDLNVHTTKLWKTAVP